MAEKNNENQSEEIIDGDEILRRIERLEKDLVTEQTEREESARDLEREITDIRDDLDAVASALARLDDRLDDIVSAD